MPALTVATLTSLFKLAFAALVLFISCTTTIYSDEPGYSDKPGRAIDGLVKSGFARSDLLDRDCSQMYGLKADRYVCGYLKVPENYKEKNSKIIKIPFLVIMPDVQSIDNTLEPLLVTGGGGPGNGLLGNEFYEITEDEFWTYEEMSVFDGRVLIILENRGVGPVSYTHLTLPTTPYV